MLLQRIYSDSGKINSFLQSSRCVVSCLKVLELGETYKFQKKNYCRLQGISNTAVQLYIIYIYMYIHT